MTWIGLLPGLFPILVALTGFSPNTRYSVRVLHQVSLTSFVSFSDSGDRWIRKFAFLQSLSFVCLAASLLVFSIVLIIRTSALLLTTCEYVPFWKVSFLNPQVFTV